MIGTIQKIYYLRGRYFESQDKGWVICYQKIVSGNSAHLFDINSSDDFNRYVMGNCENIVENIVEEEVTA